jgi:hypothetical protein
LHYNGDKCGELTGATGVILSRQLAIDYDGLTNTPALFWVQ